MRLWLCPRTPLGELTALPRPSSWIRGMGGSGGDERRREWRWYRTRERKCERREGRGGQERATEGRGKKEERGKVERGEGSSPTC